MTDSCCCILPAVFCQETHRPGSCLNGLEDREMQTISLLFFIYLRTKYGLSLIVEEQCDSMGIHLACTADESSTLRVDHSNSATKLFIFFFFINNIVYIIP